MLGGEERTQLWVLGGWAEKMVLIRTESDTTEATLQQQQQDLEICECKEILKTGVGLDACSSTSGSSR